MKLSKLKTLSIENKAERRKGQRTKNIRLNPKIPGSITVCSLEVHLRHLHHDQ